MTAPHESNVRRPEQTQTPQTQERSDQDQNIVLSESDSLRREELRYKLTVSDRDKLQGDEAMALFTSGVDAWNEWVIKNPEVDIDFSEMTFYGPLVDFRGCLFPKKGHVLFRAARFMDANVDFSGCEFGEGIVDFSDVHFGFGYVRFKYITFLKGELVFERAKFGDGEVDFFKARFHNCFLDFRQTTFGKGLKRFREVVFGDGWVTFRESDLGDGDVVFTWARFGDTGVKL